MRQIRIYQPGFYKVGDELPLTEEASLHVGQVLRMKPGEKLTLFCGDNIEFEALITEVHKKKVLVQIQSEKKQSRESPRNIHLVQGLSKGERMEMVVQKAVELGVVGITPVITSHCSVKLDKIRLAKKWRQWQAIAISASEQSGRNLVPHIYEPVPLMDYLLTKPRAMHFVLSPTSKKTWRDYTVQDEDLSLIVGPEGGFSLQELTILSRENCASLSLGPRILRTETAAIAAITLFQVVWGDF